jgi:hypothetical protein
MKRLSLLYSIGCSEGIRDDTGYIPKAVVGYTVYNVRICVHVAYL